MTTDPLRVALQELAAELQPHGIKLIVGGGYGLVLRAQQSRAAGIRTRRQSVPPVRGTEDIDFFLQSEIILDGSRTQVIRATLDRLGYKPVMQYLQFTRTVDYQGQRRVIKIDFLAAPVPLGAVGKVKMAGKRIRPATYSGLHAYMTPEAFSLEEDLRPIDVSDDGSGLLVYLPHPFTFLVLKLIALRDRLDGPEANLGKYHALDLFTIWSTITEAEWGEAERLRSRFAHHPLMPETCDALRHLFGSAESSGVVALRDQSKRQRVTLTDEDIQDFRADLHALLLDKEWHRDTSG